MKLSSALRIQPSEVVAIVGGGGKTSTMFRLATELAPTHRVLTTTTTRLFTTQAEQAPARVTFDPAHQTLADILPALEQALEHHGQVMLTHPPQGTKAPGLAPDLVDSIAAAGLFEVIIMEADGSRQRPFKAPAPYEPVIPASTTLVVPVVGLDVLGKPLTSEYVHRPELVSQLSGAPFGTVITPQLISQLLSHADGGFKNVPPNARVVPLLNKSDLAETESINQLRHHLLNTSASLSELLIGAVQDEANPIHARYGRVGVVILAAGGSSRFGSPKQLAQWQGQTLLERAIETALAIAPHQTVVVLGAEVAQSSELLGRYPVEVVINSAWAEGQSTSMRAGLTALSPTIKAAIFMVVDLPRLTPPVLQAVLSRYQQTGAPVVWPEYQGRRGQPVLFDHVLFEALHQIEGDTGGRPVLQAHRHEAERVAVSEAGILYDVDYPADLAGKE